MGVKLIGVARFKNRFICKAGKERGEAGSPPISLQYIDAKQADFPPAGTYFRQ